jgi:hypothetical protein
MATYLNWYCRLLLGCLVTAAGMTVLAMDLRIRVERVHGRQNQSYSVTPSVRIRHSYEPTRLPVVLAAEEQT